MTQSSRILQSDVSGDSDLSGDSRTTVVSERQGSGEPQDIGGSFFLKKAKIQRTHGTAGGDQDIDSSGHAGSLAGAQDKTIERAGAQSRNLLLEDDQVRNLGSTVPAKTNGGHWPSIRHQETILWLPSTRSTDHSKPAFQCQQ